MTIVPGIALPSQPAQATPLTPSSSGQSPVSFQDILDTINPLQHIPVVSGLYRAATGTTISSGAKLAGDAAYSILLGGGALGIAASAGAAAADAVSTQVSGHDVSANVINAITPSQSPVAAGTPLVADDGQAAAINAQSVPASSYAPQFYPMDPHPTVTASEYHRAQIHGEFDKKLVQMIS